MAKEEKIALFIPPTYDRAVPPLGTPALAGFLKSKGINVAQGDLNICYFDYIKKNRLEKIFTSGYRKNKIKKKVYYHKILQYKGAEISSDYDFEVNPGSSFAFTEMMLSAKFLHRYIADQKENPFVDFFYKQVFLKIKKQDFSLIGFSIICPSQVMASFTFGYLIKKYFPETKIVIGGQWVSYYREELQKRNDFNSFYDYLIYFEGETPLFKLINAIRNNKALSRVPNLIYQDKGSWKLSSRITQEDMDMLPAPDFDGLNLRKYFNSKRKLTASFETSRGCYWNKCIFCVDLPLPKSRYREKSPGLVIKDIKKLIRKYRIRHLMISNAVFSPSQMRQISKKILKEKIKLSWWAWARFDDGFDKETLSLAKRAGCSMLGFGLESINQRVLDFIGKGTRVEVIKRIIKDSRNLKLNVYFQSIIALPSETVEEAFDTISFLANHSKALNTDCGIFNVYYQVPKNPAFLNPGNYGIEIIYDKRLPFRFFYPFKHTLGNIDKPKAIKMLKIYDKILEYSFKKHRTIVDIVGQQPPDLIPRSKPLL
ncbi:B12-binding domain-containing radical SAM protein [Candidatus Omnitrophota bacterium]